MATRPPDTIGADGWTVVRLSDVPLDLREAVAHELASAWKLKGIPYLLFLTRARNPTPEQDVMLEVPVAKARLVAEGKRPRCAMPKELREDLRLPPLEFVR